MEESRPRCGAGSAGWRLRCRAGSAAGMWRARYRSLRCRAGMCSKAQVGVLRDYMEVYQKVAHFKFPGQGQRDSPVADLRTTLLVVLRLRSQYLSAKVVDVFVRYLGGDPKLAGRASWARHQTRLGEPVGRARTWASHQTRLGQANKRGWGEPSNEVGASQY